MFNRGRDTRKIASWNCKVNRDNNDVVNAVRDIIFKHDPDALSLQEALKYRLDLEDEFDDRYEFVYDPTATFENRRASTILMVKRSKRLKRSNVLNTLYIRNDEEWVGPEGGTQPGRSYPVALCRDNWAYFGIHRVTAYSSRNSTASVEENKALVLNMKRAAAKGYNFIAAGDWNSTAQAEHPRSVKGIARATHSNLLVGAGVDHAIGYGVKATCWIGPKYGSDHSLKVWTVIRSKKR